VKVSIWGTRGSLAAPGKETARYGGNTSCVQVEDGDGTVLVLDAGTGIRALGTALRPALRRVDILLTHLHMDHIQGLGFFAPLFNPQMQVHIWGPPSAALDLRSRLMRYLSPPLFPVHLRDLPCQLFLHEVPCPKVQIGTFQVVASLVCHPGPTVGYRIECGGRAMAYLPDHEPALGKGRVESAPEWTSGCSVAEGVDLLIHDAQYTDEEYASRVGWGHSSLAHAFQFAQLAGVKHLMPFHHDPTHDDATLDKLLAGAIERAKPTFAVSPAKEGDVVELIS
jgi:phosphoribosyl 1,2-cyclic phosphodiesterase